ncbi:nitrilase-related carbon-nitrogen hydrolase [Thermopolyspora sp. NPDC052614]|uniref:nitrilase-related carbon-nitrogen hydrolase n=1 Tax=Thermopolyspora sp. NPDC052614 TaxID=3155682 RepID=UPI0034359C08
MRTEQVARRSGVAASGGDVPADDGRRPWLWLGVGALFVVLTHLGVAVAAWLFPVFLLRFARTGPAFGGLLAVWAVIVGGALVWTLRVAVPLNLIVGVGIAGLATLTFVPFVLDRWFAARGGAAGSLLLLPAAMAACEFLMTLISPFGTAFGVLAPTQHGNLALLQVDALTGPYGVAFLVGWFATVVNHVWAGGWRMRRSAGAVAVYACVLALVLVAGGARLALAAPSGPAVRTAGISPDDSVTAEMTRALGAVDGSYARRVAGLDPARVRPVFERVNGNLLARSREAARAGAKIVFWSEQAANVLAADEAAFLGRVAAVAREQGVYLQAAVHLYLPREPYAANRTYLFGPDGGRLWTYDKSHPIPGLEFYPPGKGVVPVVSTPYGRLASVICFDADFPELMRVDADIMIVPARDWAEIGPVHSRMAGMRAVENGYSMIRQGEFGVSGAFDAQGRTLAEHVHQRGDRHVVFADVPVGGSATPYRVVGDVFAWLCLAGVAALIGVAVRAGRGRASTGSRSRRRR